MSLSVFVFSCKPCRVWHRKFTSSARQTCSRKENSVHLIPRVGPSIALFITLSMAMLNRTADTTRPCLAPDISSNAYLLSCSLSDVSIFIFLSLSHILALPLCASPEICWVILKTVPCSWCSCFLSFITVHVSSLT